MKFAAAAAPESSVPAAVASTVHAGAGEPELGQAWVPHALSG
jgi:hypothetical protein